MNACRVLIRTYEVCRCWMQKDDKTRNNALLFLPYINFRSRTNSETQARTPQKHHHSVVLIITFLIVMQQVKRVVVLFFSVLHFNTFHGFLTPHFPGQDRGKTDEGVFFESVGISVGISVWGLRSSLSVHLPMWFEICYRLLLCQAI